MKNSRDWLFMVVVFVLLAVLNTTSFLAAREAEKEAKRVRTALEQINITSQNRCIIQVVLSYPPPISQEQFDIVLADYDACIKRETANQ